MSTSDHPETDGQTERAKRVLEESFGVMSIRLQLERIPADGGVRHQHFSPCVDDAHAVLREWLTPSSSFHLLECESRLRGEGTHSSDRQSGSHSSRADNAVTTFDADVDVDHIQFGEEEERKRGCS